MHTEKENAATRKNMLKLPEIQLATFWGISWTGNSFGASFLK